MGRIVRLMACIIIVDDDPTVRAVATELLRHDDHAILEAADGDEALALIRAVPVDLVVLDMLMPNKDGIETIIELRRNHPHVRILAISSGGRMDGETLLQMAITFGADETMLKPLRLSTFALSVASLLARPARVDMARVPERAVGF